MHALTPIRTVADCRRFGPHARPVLIAVGAGLAYGCWAAFAHFRSGLEVALHAGLTQAALSLSATLVLALTLERLFRWPPNPVHGFWLAALGNSTLTTSWLVFGHLVAGTSDIALTIAPSLIVGIASNFAYSRMLLVQARRNAIESERLERLPSGVSGE
ncbi:hypothetical protein AWC22_10630 [Mycobacterium riyadhense]|uniref:Uncharacterized protein n=1 Tax=Mycobacterium riyadhense TaxID=486698 RepID=A0A1X2DF10_9MYCO|nr:hypothetical protein AWC22_10630 [Mycobacterium riyadhense]